MCGNHISHLLNSNTPIKQKLLKSRDTVTGARLQYRAFIALLHQVKTGRTMLYIFSVNAGNTEIEGSVCQQSYPETATAPPSSAMV